MVQHPDLTAICKTLADDKTKASDELMKALNHRQNGIVKAHRIGDTHILVIFDRETLPLDVVPMSYINEGKRLTVRVTKIKPVRCMTCQFHGHSADACPTGVVHCPYCGLNHKYSDCPVRKRRHQYECVNCYNRGNRYWGHGAFDNK